MGCKVCNASNSETSLMHTGSGNLAQENNNRDEKKPSQEDYKNFLTNFNQNLSTIGEYYKGDFNEIEKENYSMKYNIENPFEQKEQYFNNKSVTHEMKAIQLKNGDIYQGNWNTNFQMEGYGKYFIPDKKIFIEGIWNDGQIKYGRIILDNDDIYEGELKDKKSNGKGKLISKDYIYEGDFVDGVKSGECEIKYTNDNTIYKGSIKNGQLNGKGKMEWEKSCTYEGEFKDGALNGWGTITEPSGEKYEGQFENNYFHGKGKYTFSNGSFYEGDFYYGIKKGKGTYIEKDQFKFEGTWDHDLPYGNGRLMKIDESAILKSIWRYGTISEEPKYEKGTKDDFRLINLDIKPYSIKIDSIKLNHLCIGNSAVTQYNANIECSFLKDD